MANLGLTELAEGKLDDAERYLAEAAAESARLDHPYISLGISANLTLVRARRGDWDVVLVDADRLLQELATFDFVDPDYSHPLEEMAQLAMQAGHEDLGTRLADRAELMQASLGLDTMMKFMADAASLDELPVFGGGPGQPEAETSE